MAEYIDKQIVIDAIATVLNTVADAEGPQQWVPCSERLPDKPIRVQAQLDNWWIVTAYYDNAWHTVPDIGQELKSDEVIAWMPLPEPWRGES